MGYRHLLTFVLALLPLSASAADPITWSYSDTDCINADGVPAQADQSVLTITPIAKSKSVRVEWQTKLLAGYDEEAATNADGSLVQPVTMVTAAKPVSASWDIEGKYNYSFKANGTKTSQWMAEGDPVISNDPASDTKSSSGSDTTATSIRIMKIESHGKSEFYVQLGQLLGSQTWYTSYSAKEMIREVFFTQVDGSTGLKVTRACGPNAGKIVKDGATPITVAE